MTQSKLMRSAILAVALLWQCLANFLVPAEAASPTSNAQTRQEKVRQIAALAAALPALVEIKPFDKPLKIENSKLPTLRETLVSSILTGPFFLSVSSANLNFRAPVHRGYWLLFRSLRL